MTVFVDSNIIVKAFTENNDKNKCRKILNENFITDALCLIEAHKSITTIKDNKTYSTKCIKSLFKKQGKIIDLDINLLFETLKRIEKYNLDIFDLIHYTTALLNNCSEFISYDKHFDNLEIKRIEP